MRLLDCPPTKNDLGGIQLFFLYYCEFYFKKCIKLPHLIYNVILICFQPSFPFLNLGFQKGWKAAGFSAIFENKNSET